MIGFKTFLIIYLFGGITFIPTVILVLYYLNKNFKSVEFDEDDDEASNLIAQNFDPNFKAGKFEDETGVKTFKKGWITVTREYYYHFSELSKLNTDSDTDQVLGRSQLKKKHRFYAVLRHGNLFLYRKDDTNSDLVNAISLVNCFVTIWPRDPNNEVLDGSLFTKRTCLVIIKKDGVSYDAQENNIIFNTEHNELEVPTSPSGTASLNNFNVNNANNRYFLYFENNMDKEDWYFQLINATKDEQRNSNVSPLNPTLSANVAHLNTHDMLYLIQNLNSTEGQLHSKWFNALIGRLFLSLQQTDTLNDYIYKTVCKKLSKINKPGFLDDLVVEDVDVGSCAPLITNPQLRELSPEGFTKIAFDFHYKGDMSINVATKVNISLGARFKQREVSIQLALKVKEISGPVILIIKPPPSNRIWYAFETDPTVNLEIEPIVSASKLSYNVVTNAIKSKFIEAIKESLVYPYMDDIVFFSTENEIFRGGIWEKKTEHKDENQNDVTNSFDIKPPTRENYEVRSSQDMYDSNKKHNYINDSASINSSFDLNSTQSSAVKRQTLEKVGLLKDAIQHRKGNPSSNIDINDAGSINSSNSALNTVDDNPDDETNSKKYFKNSFKRIGKWYKENLNNNEEADQPVSSIQPQHDMIFNSDTVSEAFNIKRKAPDVAEGSMDPVKEDIKGESRGEGMPHGITTANLATPMMISNRRRPVPKVPVLPHITIADSADTVNSNLNKSPISPSLNSTEMFVNHERTRSISSSSSNDVYNYMNSSFNKQKAQGFFKLNESANESLLENTEADKAHIPLQHSALIIKKDLNISNSTLHNKFDE